MSNFQNFQNNNNNNNQNNPNQIPFGMKVDPSSIQNISEIPIARKFQNISPLNNPLPSIPLTPKQPISKFQAAYNQTSQAKNLIQTRLNKLNYEKNLLRNFKQSFNPYNPDLQSIYNLRTLSNAKGQLANPSLYSHQFMDPIYYPLEMPISAEPVTLPKIEMGHPMNNKHRCGLGVEDLISLLALFKKNETKTVQAPPQQPIIYPPMPYFPPPDYDNFNKKKKKKIPVIPESTYKPAKKIGIKRDWWKLARDFVNVYLFFSTANKYAQFSKVRNSLISQKSKSIVQDVGVLKEWLISLEESFWEEFKIFTDLNVSFKNIDSQLKIQKESQKIIAMIKKFLENLISKSTKLQDIPERVQKIIYEYIKDRAYFPKKYLTTFQVYRIDFNFYGGTKSLNDEQIAMLLSFLLISGVAVQQILLHMKDVFIEFRNYPNIEISAKYIGSIMHYLVRDTFSNNPTMIREILALLNYYRNYHLYNEQVEKQEDIFNTGMAFIDNDEFAEFLIPENNITEFWNLNTAFVDTFKNYVYAWSNRLAKLIKLKYQKSDVNLLPKRRYQRPQDKSATYIEVDDD